MVKKKVNSLPLVTGTRVKVQQSFGRTTISTLMTRDISGIKLCTSSECIICTASGAVGKCRDQSIIYQINCIKEPYNLDFDSLKLTAVPQTPKEPLALYVGETSRSGFWRETNHLTVNRL